MKMRPSLTAYKQNNRNVISDCISIKLTDFWFKFMAVALVVLSSFSFGKRIVKQDISISMPKTLTVVNWASLKSFQGTPNRSVS